MTFSSITPRFVRGFRSLAEGQKVEFSVVQGQKGLAAEGVVPV